MTMPFHVCRYIPSLVTVVAGLKVEQIVCGSEHTLALLSLTHPRPPLPPGEGYFPPHLRPSSSSLFRRQSLPLAQSAAEHFAQMGHQHTHEKLQKRLQPGHEQKQHHIPPRLDTAMAGGSLDAIPIPAENGGSTISMTSLKEGNGCNSLEAIVGQNEENTLRFNDIALQQTCLSGMSSQTGSLSHSSPAQSASLDSVSAVTTDSGTASSTSDHSSAPRSSRSTADPIRVPVLPAGDDAALIEKQRTTDDGLPRLMNSEIRSDLNDQPSTLSPIDSPRTIAQYSPSVDTKVASQEQRREVNERLDNVLHNDQLARMMPQRVSGIRGGGQSQYKPSNALQPRSVFLSEKSATLPARVSALHVQQHYVPKQSSSLSLNTTSSGGIDTGRLSTSFAQFIDFPCIYSWGWNEHGNCGLGSTENVTVPQRVPVEGKVLLVAAGSGHSFALIRNYCKVAL